MTLTFCVQSKKKVCFNYTNKTIFSPVRDRGQKQMIPFPLDEAVENNL